MPKDVPRRVVVEWEQPFPRLAQQQELDDLDIMMSSKNGSGSLHSLRQWCCDEQRIAEVIRKRQYDQPNQISFGTI